MPNTKTAYAAQALVVRCDRRTLGLNLSDVREIVRKPPTSTRIGGLEVLCLRGRTIPIIDSGASLRGVSARLIVMDTVHGSIAVPVDEVIAVQRFDPKAGLEMLDPASLARGIGFAA